MNKVHYGPANPHPLSQMKTELVWEGKYDEYGNRRKVDVAGLYMPLQKIETVDQPRFEAAAKGQLDAFEKATSRQDDSRNMLIWGDNKLVMASLLKDFKGQIDLIYIDPPFDVGADFTMEVPIGDEGDGIEKDQSTLEMVAYRDMWGKGTDSYLFMIHERLLLMKDLLSEKGSIYVHCDYRLDAQIRLILDEIFGMNNFLNEIIWKRGNHKQTENMFLISHDNLLFFSKSNGYSFNPQYGEYDAEYIRKYYCNTDPDGKKYQLQGMYGKGSGPAMFFGDRLISPPKGLHWRWTQERINEAFNNGLIVFPRGGDGMPRFKDYLDNKRGVPVRTIWDDVYEVNSQALERVDYPTQKSESLLERIIKASSNEGDLVADFFCLRKGTRVLTHLGPPAASATPLNPPASGGKEAPSPLAGKAGMGSVDPGKVRIGSSPIESLRPGDLVYAHDSLPHRVLRVIRRRYSEIMVGLRVASGSSTLWLTPDHLVLCERSVKALSEEGEWSAIPRKHFESARTMRKEMTPPERMLWKSLRQGQFGVKFRRQHPIGPYITDFYSREAALVVEVDGSQHGATSDAVEYDQARDEYMERLGLKVLRLPAVEVLRNSDAVVRSIGEATREQVLSEDTNKQWRFAAHLQVGDIVYCGIEQIPT